MSKKNSVTKQTQSSPKIPVETTSTLKMYSGPIPAPSTLEHYESILVPNEKVSTQSSAKDECRHRRKGRKDKAQIGYKKYVNILRCDLCEVRYEEPLRSLREIR